MRKLLYSFLFFISSKSFPRRLSMPNLRLLCIGMCFVVYSNYGQCSYPVGASRAGSTDYMFCIDSNSNIITAGSIQAGNYVVLNVIRGYTYTFSGDIFNNANENITIFNEANNSYVGVGGSGSGTTTNLTWRSTLSGKIKILLNKTGCNNDNSNASNSLRITLNSLENTLDDQTSAGADVWRGHIYNWTSNTLPPGGSSSPSTPQTTTPFSATEYAGYYDFGSETIGSTYNFGGDSGCFNVFSDGVQRASINKETFAVRYRMKSTRPAGCYLVTLRGDDGVRLYVDNVKVFDEWKEQSSTEYSNVLVYLKGPGAGGSDLLLDYYENGGSNQVSFSITPFDVNSNTIVAPSPSVVCSGTRPNTIIGSSYIYNGGTVNPTIRFQWQTATNINGPWADINGATSDNFRPQALSPTSPVVNYYRRVVSASSTSATACTWSSNVISITTGVSGSVASITPVLNPTTNLTCSSFTANWNSVSTASSYRIDVSTSNNFTSGFVLNNVDIGLVTSYNVTGLTLGTTYYYRIRALNICGGSTSNYSNQRNATPVLPTVSISGNTTVCQNAISPNITFTNLQSSAITVTYNVNGGSNTTVNVQANSFTTVPVLTNAIGTFTYNLVNVVYEAVPSCTRNPTGTATVVVGIGNNIITYNNGNSNAVCAEADEHLTANFVAPAGTYFNTVSFASYGSPTGSCGAFQVNYACHSPIKSQSYTESRLLGNTGTIGVIASNDNFDDPCVGTFKGFKAIARYSEPICAGTIPGQISGSIPTGSGTYTYLWEMSTTSSTSGFNAAPGTNNNQHYIPTVAVTGDTWFRRTVTSGGFCPNISAVVLVKVNPSPTLTVASQSGAICSGSAATINLSGLLAGSTSTISYTIDGTPQTPITSVVATAGGTASFTTAVLASANNGQILQITGLTTTSTTPNCSQSFARNVTLVVNNTPTLTGASQSTSVCTGSAATINLTGLLAGSTSTISYTIGGTPQTAVGSVVATAAGTASFTTPILTNANNGQVLQIIGVTTTSSTPNCSQTFARDVTLSVNPLPAPSIVKGKDFTCESGGTVVLSNLPATWTINQTGEASQTTTGTDNTSTITGLVPGTYNFTVTNNSTSCISNVASIEITDLTSTTVWNGSGWSNDVPNENKRVIIASVNPNQPFPDDGVVADIKACSLEITVPVGSVVTIPSNVTLTVANALTTNDKLEFENGSALLQGDNAVNSGHISYKRQVSVSRYDVVYWGSPVTNSSFKMRNFSPNTLWDKYHYWDLATAKWVLSSYGEEVMQIGKGYSIRAPQNFDIVTPAIFQGVFVGVPNNGDISVPVMQGKLNFIGNPYPSAVDALQLILDNRNDLGSLYFWTHNLPPQRVSGTNTFRYQSADFVVFNGTGSTRVTGELVTGSDAFNGFIGAGQAFFTVAPATATAVKFDNSLRRGSANNTQFYKTAEATQTNRNRIWLNVSNSKGAFKQLLLGYLEGATNGIDAAYDAITIASNSNVDFYTINEGKKLTIQGRALPFDNTEIIPLGFKCGIDASEDRNITFSIDHTDGFFDNQEVYLEDKILGKVIDLRKENYTFTSEKGTYSTRFVLRYTNKTLGTDEFENLENSVFVAVKDKTVKITSAKETLKEVNIYNVGAQLLYNNEKVNATELEIKNLHSSDQVILVQITLENGHSFTKKVIFSNL